MGRGCGFVFFNTWFHYRQRITIRQQVMRRGWARTCLPIHTVLRLDVSPRSPQSYFESEWLMSEFTIPVNIRRRVFAYTHSNPLFTCANSGTLSNIVACICQRWKKKVKCKHRMPVVQPPRFSQTCHSPSLSIWHIYRPDGARDSWAPQTRYRSGRDDRMRLSVIGGGGHRTFLSQWMS